MSQSYIFATQSATLSGPRPSAKPVVPLKEFVAVGAQSPGPGVGDQVLIASGKADVYEALEPHVYRIAAVDKQSLALELDRAYVTAVPLEKVRQIINRALSNGANPLTAAENQAILALLGSPKPTEGQLLDHIKRYIAARGYYFDGETIHNYHISLKTRPFVILAGLSGTGKSKLPQLYAEAIGHSIQNERYLRVAVRPSWNDDRYLLGYLNSITDEYVTEPAIDFIIQAERDRDNLYFFCLDEMNLAHVEHYFSQFLSALEEENPADRRIPLYSKATQEKLHKQGKEMVHERVVIVPPNLLFTGTVNVDETTQPLSDKVIDRANTIEFFEVELDKVPQRRPPPDPVHISAPVWHSYAVQEPDTAFRPRIVELGKILNEAGLGLGYRVLREVELYLANSTGLLKPEVAFDLQVKQRILPRVRGTQVIQPMLKKLSVFMKQHSLSRSVARLEEMENRLKRDGYTSFWR